MKRSGNFFIENKKFCVQDLSLKNSFIVKSVPRPYSVVWDDSSKSSGVINNLVLKNKGNLLLIDKNVYLLFKDTLNIPKERIFIARASEKFKTINGVIKLIDFLRRHDFTKGEQLIVAGGGIIQDVAAFVCACYKRGIPWVYLPTTLLSMCDSCIGGKTGINYKGAKNQLALFSAPSRVIIMPGFLKTLKKKEINSGLGEILKLCITGGRVSLDRYKRAVCSGKINSEDCYKRLILGALAVKKVVVEEDEFELNYRKSLNYGHTIGHVLEIISDYRIPHGQAVVAGMIVVNELSFKKGLLSERQKSELLPFLFELLDIDLFQKIKFNSFEALLRKDKKNTGNIVNLVIIESIGRTKFLPLKIESSLLREIVGIIKSQFTRK